jgi:hypothetical protein
MATIRGGAGGVSVLKLFRSSTCAVKPMSDEGLTARAEWALLRNATTS